MNAKRLRFVLLAIALVAMAGMTLAAQRSTPNGGVIDPTCTSSLPCIEYDNNSTGPGIRGISKSGNGLAGATKNAGTPGKAGLLGNDVGSGTFNSGVAGLSITGTGVSGSSTNGDGMNGTSEFGTGIVASSRTGIGLTTSSDQGIALSASSPAFVGIKVTAGTDGIDAGTRNPSATDHVGKSGVFAHDDSTDAGSLNFGVFGVSARGIGIFGGSTNGSGVFGNSTNHIGVFGTGNIGLVGQATGTATNTAGIDVFGHGNEAAELHDTTTGGVFINGIDSSNDLEFQVQDTGDVFAHSFNSSLMTQRQPTTVGRQIATYAHQSSVPTLEDFGEAQLTGGHAYVQFEPNFASAIDQHTAYLVFLTPEGDTRGLYVTQRTLAGFSVRENQGGHSTVAFSYRIVAKPFGSAGARMPLARQMIPARMAPRPLVARVPRA